MKVSDLTEKASLNIFNMGDPDREVKGGYCGDLLSWVMGNAEADSAWITIMSNKNVAAVSVMTDVSCVILSEGVEPDKDMLSKAVDEGLNILGSPKSTFAVATDIAKLI